MKSGSKPDITQAAVPKSTGYKVALSAAFVSEAGIPVYEKMMRYLEKRLGEPFLFVTGFSYETISEMLKQQLVDMAFICGLPYVLTQEEVPPTTRLVAAPIMKAERYHGKPIYYSDIIVRRQNPAKRFEDLKGETFVYNEETSNSGYNLPRYYMVRHGLTHGFFSKVLRSGSHEESIRMVAIGQADASSVDSLVLDYELATHEKFAREIRVIQSLGPAPVVPVVVRASLSEARFQRLQEELLKMHLDPEGRKILDEAQIERFAKVDDQDYDFIRKMLKTALDAGFPKIK